MSSHKHHPVYRTGELESELEVARSLTKEALAQVAAKDAALREIIDLIKACKGKTRLPLTAQILEIAEATAGERKPTGVWPDWGDSPRGFDGPGGAE